MSEHEYLDIIKGRLIESDFKLMKTHLLSFEVIIGTNEKYSLKISDIPHHLFIYITTYHRITEPVILDFLSLSNEDSQKNVEYIYRKKGVPILIALMIGLDIHDNAFTFVLNHNNKTPIIPVLYDLRSEKVIHQSKPLKSRTAIEAPINLIDTYFNLDLASRKADLTIKDYEVIASKKWPIINRYYHPDVHPNQVKLESGELEYLLKHKDSRVRASIAERRDLTEPMINKLALDNNKKVRSSVARNQPLSRNNMILLLEDNNKEISGAIAARKDIHPEVFNCLVVDKRSRIRKILASRYDLTPELIGKLAYDESFEVRAVIAERRNLPKTLILELAKDTVPIRQRIANNDTTPDDVLEILSHDKDLKVRKMALNNIKEKKLGYTSNSKKEEKRRKKIEDEKKKDKPSRFGGLKSMVKDVAVSAAAEAAKGATENITSQIEGQLNLPIQDNALFQKAKEMVIDQVVEKGVSKIIEKKERESVNHFIKPTFDTTPSSPNIGRTSQLNCPNCKKTAKIEDKFCTNCGRYLEA